MAARIDNPDSLHDHLVCADFPHRTQNLARVSFGTMETLTSFTAFKAKGLLANNFYSANLDYRYKMSMLALMGV